MAEMPYNPVVVSKHRGTSKEIDTTDNLADEDFLLGIQTEFQCDLLQQSGVYISSVHGLNPWHQLL